MNLETAKSFILVILIGSSIILSFGMLNYQTETTPLSEESYEQVDVGGVEKGKSSLIAPNDIIFKSNGNFFGFSETEQREQLYASMQSWTLSDITTSVYEERTPSTYEVEIIFPSEIPFELISSMFSVSEENSLPYWSFERIYITFNSDIKSLEVEFVSIDGRERATALINSQENYDQLWSYMTNVESDMFRSYTLMDEAAEDIYIPSGVIELNKATLLYTGIEPSDLRDALFLNPSVVSESTNAGVGITYFTDSRQMQVDSHNLGLEYVNLVSDNPEENSLSEVSILERSILNINDHKGWTADFKLDELGTNPNMVKYRMYYNGYPVFNNSSPDLSIIEQTWSNGQQLEEYNRPLLNYGFSTETSSSLPSGEYIIGQIESDSDYNQEEVEDIKIGYRLKANTDDRSVVLEPIWYVKTGGHWSAVVLKDSPSQEGGD
ncbi:YycH family regulatory protein [Oceanobacillus massiliensis]|uniref:YycH family regulatory protein n=1 Tax=Oceanobacillus massiliensis TaxID=1465765 RepID=UPI00301984D8